MNKLKFIPLLCGLLFVENFHTDNNCTTIKNVNSEYRWEKTNLYTKTVIDNNSTVVKIDDAVISFVEFCFKVMKIQYKDGTVMDFIDSQAGKNLIQQMKRLKGQDVCINVRGILFVFSNCDQFKNLIDDLNNDYSAKYKKKSSHWWYSWFRK